MTNVQNVRNIPIDRKRIDLRLERSKFVADHDSEKAEFAKHHGRKKPCA